MNDEQKYTHPYRNWSLIQRLSKASRPSSAAGVDSLVTHEYMGSAEFEFGAVPKAWAQLRLLGAQSSLVRLETPFTTVNHQPFYCIAPKDLDHAFVFKALEGCYKKQYHTQEYTHMDYWMPSTDTFMRDARNVEYAQRTVAWLALEAAVFWTVDKDLCDAIWREVSAGYCTSPADIVVGDTVRFVLDRKQRSAVVKEVMGETVIVSMQSDHSVRSVLYTEVYKPVR